MIRVMNVDGRNCPVVICDICGEPITNANQGAAIFENFTERGSVSETRFAHKGTCHNIEEADGKNARWDELNSFLRDLCENTRVDFTRARSSDFD